MRNEVTGQKQTADLHEAVNGYTHCVFFKTAKTLYTAMMLAQI